MIMLSWFGIIGYGLIAYAIFAEGQEWAFGGAAFFLIFFLIRYHSLNPFAPWTSKKSSTNSNNTSNVQHTNHNQQPQLTQQTEEPVTTEETEKAIVARCSNCGSELQDGQIYCENCGSKVS